jgi:threonine dehydratase
MKEERLKRYVEEYSASRDMESLVGHYRSSILNFLNFLNVMQGRYAEATFQEKRNALEVLGVHVDVRPTPVAKPQVAFVETEKEWLSLTEAAQLSGVSEKIIWHRAGKGEFATSKREESRRCTFVHRDEFNRFLATLTIRPRQGRDDVTSRVEISYSPMFAGVQSSLHENYQPVGAFKVRGGINYLSQLPAEARMRGVITASTGNHGQSIAYAARLFGVPARIVVPERSNPGKVAAIEGMGAKIIVHGSTFDEARLHCEALAQSEGYRYIHSANEPLLIAGVATGPLEMLEDEPDLDALIVPIGGGSGAAGACIVAQAINPAIEVIGVQAAASAAAYESWRARRLVEAANQTFAEGLATGVGFTMTQSILQEGLRDFVLVEEEEILQAMVWMIEYAHTLAEGAGASPLAAAYRLRERLQGKKVGLVCSGGNTSLAHLERALAASRSTKQA